MKLDDFLITYGAEDFKKLIAEAKYFLGSEAILVDPGDIKDITNKSWQLIYQENKRLPQVFLFGNSLVVLERESKGVGYRIIPLDNYILRHHLIRWGNWQSRKGDYIRPYVHSIVALEDILASSKQDIPFLQGVTSTPVFAADGTLVTQPGYCEKTELFFSPPPDFILPPISKRPTPLELEEAKDLILEELFGDFPFVGDAEISHAVALLVLPFVRNMINGPTPLHLIDKSTVGTGATLLARTISYICTGGEYTVLPEGRDGDEWRKRLTAVLINAPWFLVIDNLSRILDSSALAIALTQDYWEDRLLGQSKHIRIPVHCAWVATGNNPVMSSEIARRTIRIRLDARTEAPHLRNQDQFRHPHLINWIKSNRASLVRAVLIFVQHWIALGKPESKKSLGSFESWAAVVGGILESVGINGFLDNTKDFYEDVQTEAEQKKIFVAAWFKKFGQREIRAGELCRVDAINEVVADFGELGTDRSSKTKLGFFIKKIKDQVFNLNTEAGIVTVIVRRTNRKIENSTAWKLEVVERKIKIKLKSKNGR